MNTGPKSGREGVDAGEVAVLRQAFVRFNTASVDLERRYRRLEGQINWLRREVEGKDGLLMSVLEERNRTSEGADASTTLGLTGEGGPVLGCASAVSVGHAQGVSGEAAILSRDPAMLRLVQMADVAAASDVSVLIEGESGTGKERVARFIHAHSARANQPFVAVNCAAIPEGLFESELFGYEKGAFTGAVSRKPGRFERAHKGTLLLDEVSEMRSSVQAKLLRVLQEREIDPLGCTGPIALDIRVIATSNHPLWGEVQAGRFREDLYYRLNVFPLRLPPLRMRRSDIPPLALHFAWASAMRHGKPVPKISSEGLSLLVSRVWRGNVRELENVMERAVLLAGGKAITPAHLSSDDPEVEIPQVSSLPVQTTVRSAERDLILKVLGQVDGNRTLAARILGISIRTLRNKLSRYRGALDAGSVHLGDGGSDRGDSDRIDSQDVWRIRSVNGG